jgi:hypothetical protein
MVVLQMAARVFSSTLPAGEGGSDGSLLEAALWETHFIFAA